MPKKIPEDRHAATASLCVRGAAQAIEFYKKAFGAKELMRMRGPGDTIMHAEIKIGDSVIFVSDERPEMQESVRSPQTLRGSTASLYLYVDDVDLVYARAIKAGAKPTAPLADMFWGDRHGQIQDPFGHIWSLATHQEDLSREEIIKRQQECYAAALK